MKDIGKVVRILDDKKVIVDLGSDDKVKEGMKFVIYEQSEEIFDPDTGDSLGIIDIIKHRLKVVNVMEKMSIMESDEYTKEPIYNLASMMNSMPTHKWKQESFNVDEEEIKPIHDINYKLKEGDKVRKSLRQSD